MNALHFHLDLVILSLGKGLGGKTKYATTYSHGQVKVRNPNIGTLREMKLGCKFREIKHFISI